MVRKNGRGLGIRLYATIIGSMFVLFALIYATYSWYYAGDSMGKLGFEIMRIDSVVTLYEGIDSNANGVVDLLSTNGAEVDTYRFTKEGELSESYVEYNSLYYEEVYDFRYLDTTLVLEKDSEANLLKPIIVENLYPSKICTYKYALANYSFAENEIRCTFDTETSTMQEMSNEEILKAFRMRLGAVREDGSVLFGAWKQFSYDGNGKPEELELSSGVEPMTISASVGENEAGRLDLWLQIQFLPESGNELQDVTAVLPDFRIHFEGNYER